MTVSRRNDNGVLTVAIEGRVDTLTAPKLESELNLDGAKDLVLDFAAVDYISSAGLRLLVRTYKAVTTAGGTLKLANVRPIVKEVFEITGFDDRFTFV